MYTPLASSTMEFGPANGRSVTPTADPFCENTSYTSFSRVPLTADPFYVNTAHTSETSISRVHKKREGGSTERSSSPTDKKRKNSVERSFSPAHEKSKNSASSLFAFPRVPTASRGATPIVDSAIPCEFPRVPCASRGVTPANEELSYRSCSPEPCLANNRNVSVQPCSRNANESRMDVSSLPRSSHGTSGYQPCYMCHFAEEAICAQYTTFILNETARSSRNQIARQVAQDIVAQDLQANRQASDGASVADIERHIALHMLSPSVKIPELIRELDDVRRLMRASITNTCPDTGTAVVDTGNVALYLRVVREQMQVYKMGDVAKLSLGSTGISASNPLATDL